jgi:hypothetical protein
MEGNTPRLLNIPRPIPYPFISESQKAIPASFLNPAWYLCFCPLYSLGAMRSVTDPGRRPRGSVRCLVAFDQMHVPQLLLFEFDEMFGVAAKRL